jgi:hypothetical protein
LESDIQVNPLESVSEDDLEAADPPGSLIIIITSMEVTKCSPSFDDDDFGRS